MLGLIFAANDQLLARGRPGLPFHLFYNDAVNQEVNLKEDYRRWKAGGSDELSLTLTLTLALTLTLTLTLTLILTLPTVAQPAGCCLCLTVADTLDLSHGEKGFATTGTLT